MIYLAYNLHPGDRENKNNGWLRHEKKYIKNNLPLLPFVDKKSI